MPGLPEQEEATQRLLEVINLLYAENGESYAQHLKTLVRVIEGAVNTSKPRIIQTAVEDVLTNFRIGEPTNFILLYMLEIVIKLTISANGGFRAGCMGVLVASLDDPNEDEKIGPTMAVILSAILCEYLDISPLPPVRALQGLALLLPLHSGMLSVTWPCACFS